MAIVYLDSSGKTRQYKVDGWYSGLEKGHWGRFGAWTMTNLDFSKMETIISDESLYFGDGYWFGWHIRYS
jgi:hypothetical protein